MKMGLFAEYDYGKHNNCCQAFDVLPAAEYPAAADPGGETPEKKERLH
jgi:hypothetical protein